MLTPVLTTLAYVLHPDGQRVLMVHRTRRDQKFNGLGGKVEPDEDVVACVRRELAEEARIEVVSMRLRGTISWPGFGADGEDHFGFVFVVDVFTGTVPTSNDEGELLWVDIADVVEFRLDMWPGDRAWLPLVFDDQVPQFHGVSPYCDGRPLGWQYSVLP